MRRDSRFRAVHHSLLAASIATLLSATSPPSAIAAADAMATPTSVDATARYIVVLREPALASYSGQSGLAKPPRVAAGRKAGRLDVASHEARRYVAHLTDRQSTFLSQLAGEFGRSIKVVDRTQHAINSIILELSADEAATIANHREVALVERQDVLPFDNSELGPSFVGASQVWDGTASGGIATQGEGTVIGVIDSGINWQSPSFAAVDPINGYQHINPLGSGQYLGTCSPSSANAPDLGHCNDKLIGMYNFTTFRSDGMDYNGHGSHTASTAAGNHRVVEMGGSIGIAGVAPRANIVAFNCLSSAGGCDTTAVVRSVEQAVADGVVDVLSYSVSGGTRPWTESVSLAFLGATEAGIFVAAAAGNNGPDPATVGHLEPWVTTVGASTYDFAAAMPFTLHVAGGAPPDTLHIGVHPGGTTNLGMPLSAVPIVRSPTFDSVASDGCNAFPPGTFLRNGVPALAVMTLNNFSYTCGSSLRRDNALNAGAAAVLYVENSESFLYVAVENVWTMQMRDWNAVWQAMQSAAGEVTASIALPMAMYPQRGDRIPAFSSRGPNAAHVLNGQLVSKPDLVAPGLDVLAAHHLSPDDVTYMNGTSMATPHVSGAAALIRAVHPSWTPMEVKSALMSTAWNQGILTDENRATNALAYGSGRLDVAAAVRAGIVLDESGDSMRDANPALDGIYAHLNIPSGLFKGCSLGQCTLTRRVRSTRATPTQWSAEVSGIPGSYVTPAAFELAPGATQEIVVSVHPGTLGPSWAFGQVELTANDPEVPVSRMPLSVRRDEAARMLYLSSLTLSAELPFEGSATRPLILSNGGSSSVQWSVNTTEPGCTPPTWASFSPTSGSILAGGAARTVTTTFNAQGLSAGQHTGTLCIASNDSSLPLTHVSLELTVQSADTIFKHGFEN